MTIGEWTSQLHLFFSIHTFGDVKLVEYRGRSDIELCLLGKENDASTVRNIVHRATLGFQINSLVFE